MSELNKYDILIILKDAPDSYYERLKPVVDIELKLRTDIEQMMPVLSSIILSLDEANYNLAVRRAEEFVELAIKGCLRILGIDFPKVHDG